MAAGTLTVSIESVAHAAMKEAAQRVYDETGMRISSVEFQWLDLSTAEERRKVVTSVSMETTTDH